MYPVNFLCSISLFDLRAIGLLGCDLWQKLQVDSANKRGSLLEVVQVLTDLNLQIRRAYISSDGGWFMDGVFF